MGFQGIQNKNRIGFWDIFGREIKWGDYREVYGIIIFMQFMEWILGIGNEFLEDITK